MEPELGAVRRAQRRRLDARGPRARPVPVRERAAARPHEHAQQRDLGQQHAPHQGGAGPRAVQPHAHRGSARVRRGGAPGDLELRPGLAGSAGDRRAAHLDLGLVRGHLRRQRGVRAAGRRAVPQPARAARGAAQRRLRDADDRRRGRVRLRRARPALHPGDVRAAHHRPGVRRPQQDAPQRLAEPTGCRARMQAARTMQPLWSQPDQKPPRFEDGLDAAKSRFAQHRDRPAPGCTRRSWPSDHVQDRREPVQVGQHGVQPVRLHADEQPGRRRRRAGHVHQAERDRCGPCRP